MAYLLKQIRFSWPLLTLGVFYLYLGFHTFSGNQGVLRWVDDADKVSALKQRIAALDAQQEKLQKHVDQLRAASLDLDRLGEEAHRLLNISYTNEIVIWLDDLP